jgi:hypothetical protein
MTNFSLVICQFMIQGFMFTVFLAFTDEMSKVVTAVVIGAGNRGFGYSNYGTECPDEFQACIHVLNVVLNLKLTY